MEAAQFVRVEPFSNHELARLLGEASRQPGFCEHVEDPEPPVWLTGSAEKVNAAAASFMSTPCPVRLKDGTMGLRKRRDDFRSFVAGVISWPVSVRLLKKAGNRKLELKRIRKWVEMNARWLRRQFREHLIAIVFHMDEEYPHLHFFAVGDANKLHPDLRSEFADGQRLQCGYQKLNLYKAAMRDVLDDYHAEVGQHCGLARSLGGPPKPRIKDRALALRVLELEQIANANRDSDLLREIQQLVDDAPKRQRGRMKF